MPVHLSQLLLLGLQYSCVYVVLTTDSPNVLLEGYGLPFTLGRGNEIICDMCRSLQHLVVGKDLEADILPDMMGWSRTLTQDGQLRWIGPECVLTLARCVVVLSVAIVCLSFPVGRIALQEGWAFYGLRCCDQRGVGPMGPHRRKATLGNGRGKYCYRQLGTLARAQQALIASLRRTWSRSSWWN